MVGLNSDLLKDSCQHAAPRTDAASAPDPRQATADLRLCRRPSHAHRQAWIRLLWVTALFPWVPVCICFVCSLQESLFPPALWKFCDQMPLFFQVRFPGSSQSLGWIRSLRSLMWRVEPLQQCENFSDITGLQFVGRPPSGYAI